MIVQSAYHKNVDLSPSLAVSAQQSIISVSCRCFTALVGSEQTNRETDEM